MRKLMLDVEALDVETFEVADRRGPGGTVLAADAGSTVPPYCFTFTCGDSRVRPCLAD
jgi:hypothetical protein